MAEDPGESNLESRGNSCVAVSSEELIELGWNVTKLSKGFRYLSPNGKLFWSSKEVAKFLAKERTSAEVCVEAEGASSNNQLPIPTGTSSESESDSDFRPSQEPAASDDAFSSPEKRVAMPHHMQLIQKR